VVPIQDVLHRIQWDPAWRGRFFEIGYVDRVAGRILRVPFEGLRIGTGAHATLTVHGDDGTIVRIPLHRVREVWRDGALIWHRTAARSSEP
jgi:uncharacterized protein (UPF0248 family)